MKYLICFVTDGGFIDTLAVEHRLDRAKAIADIFTRLANPETQVKVLEHTKQGYRVAYIARKGEQHGN